MVAMKTAANSFVAIGVVVGCAMKFAWVSAEPVATTLAPLTTRPALVSFSTCTYTSATSPGGRWRSTGGCSSAGVRKRTRSWGARYQRRALSWYGGEKSGFVDGGAR